MEEKPVGIVEMAALLNVSSDTVRRMARAGELPHFKMGSLYRFWPSTVVEYLNAASDPWARGKRRAA